MGDVRVKIDLHLHASERSKCSIATEKQHILSAISHDLDAIVFTDHDKLVPIEHLAELNKIYKPFKIFGGIEMRIKGMGGMSEDVLVLGIHDKVLEEHTWSYPELYKYVKDHNGFIALNHPYRYTNNICIDIENFIPDAIEIHSTNIGRCDEESIKKLAEKLNTNLINNSDAHCDLHTGIYYNEIMGSPETEQELIQHLLQGKYELKKDEQRINEFNLKVTQREILIKRMIKEEKTAKDYSSITGNWEGEFHRVAMGKSYEI